ncbi:mitochondrial inner membrane protease atp23 [Myxozyma melibiosi]|uniref:Mitochondrial inner membrane protease ATP23 n=1 Tax=Myxozyma melibiosi TaxID=54550 RepID=A0ABR1FC87_9ASCO
MSAEGASSSQDKPELPSGFTWFRMLAANYTGMITDEEREIFNNVAKARYDASQCKSCESYRNFNLKWSPIINFMKDNIEKLGGEVDPRNIECVKCTETVAGGFNPDHGIMICQNWVQSKTHVEDTIAHELIHMYDELKFNVDWFNLKHHACSEVRASNLSGECRMMNQIVRYRQFKFVRAHQECVRRRAILSVTGNPNCKDKEEAARVVDQVWDSCFNDTRPFDEIYP